MKISGSQLQMHRKLTSMLMTALPLSLSAQQLWSSQTLLRKQQAPEPADPHTAGSRNTAAHGNKTADHVSVPDRPAVAPVAIHNRCVRGGVWCERPNTLYRTALKPQWYLQGE